MKKKSFFLSFLRHTIIVIVVVVVPLLFFFFFFSLCHLFGSFFVVVSEAAVWHIKNFKKSFFTLFALPQPLACFFFVFPLLLAHGFARPELEQRHRRLFLRSFVLVCANMCRVCAGIYSPVFHGSIYVNFIDFDAELAIHPCPTSSRTISATSGAVN